MRRRWHRVKRTTPWLMGMEFQISVGWENEVREFLGENSGNLLFGFPCRRVPVPSLNPSEPYHLTLFPRPTHELVKCDKHMACPFCCVITSAVVVVIAITEPNVDSRDIGKTKIDKLFAAWQEVSVDTQFAFANFVDCHVIIVISPDDLQNAIDQHYASDHRSCRCHASLAVIDRHLDDIDSTIGILKKIKKK
jgi:hypothetical protein